MRSQDYDKDQYHRGGQARAIVRVELVVDGVVLGMAGEGVMMRVD